VDVAQHRGAGVCRLAARAQRGELNLGQLARERHSREAVLAGFTTYADARLGRQFDAVLHFDVTRAVEPLERIPAWQTEEAEWETFPSAL
jgi:erythromycin esterase-like protein